MANEFSLDSNCRALYRFEDGALTTDSKSTNTLTASANPPTADTSVFKEGAAAADFVAGSNQRFTIADSALAAGFPLKSGTTPQIFTVCFWYYYTNNSSYTSIISKWLEGSTNKYCFRIYKVNPYLGLYWGYADGSYEDWGYIGSYSMAAGNWYHFCFEFNVAAKTVTVNIANSSGAQVAVGTKTFTNALNISTADLAIGGSGATACTTAKLDEVIFFDRHLTQGDLENIRAGTFTAPAYNAIASDTSCKAAWEFENGALLVDSKGLNANLTPSASAPVVNLLSFQQKTSSVTLASASSNYYTLADANLCTGFPLKSGDTTKKISVCFWFYPVTFVAWAKAFAKWDWGGLKRSIGICCNQYYPAIQVGYNGGASYQNIEMNFSTAWAGRWLHYAWVIDGIAKTAYCRIYDLARNEIVLDQTKSFSNELWVGDAPLTIGADAGGGTPINGYLDELLVFNRLLGSGEIDNIRKGLYSYDPSVSVFNTGVHVAYTTGEPGVTVDFAGLHVVYGLAGAKRIFPLPPANRIMQTQYQRRILP